ncbi:MAG: serine protease [Verrucomicrobiota bacterium]
MKSRLMLIAALVAAPLVHAADGPLKEKAIALAASNKDSVLFLSAVVELEVTVGENPAKKEERKLEMLGTVIDKDGLIVVPLSALDVASTLDGRSYNGPQGPTKLSAKGTTKEVKILMPDGSEVAAKVAFKDTDLDLAFIRPEKPDAVKLTPVDTANNAPMTLLDDVIILGRLGKDLNREPVIMTNEVISLVSKPRTFGKVGTQALGMPVFNKDGKFVGFGINRFSPKGDSDNQGPVPQNVILPAADLLESAAQAK